MRLIITLNAKNKEKTTTNICHIPDAGNIVPANEIKTNEINALKKHFLN